MLKPPLLPLSWGLGLAPPPTRIPLTHLCPMLTYQVRNIFKDNRREVAHTYCTGTQEGTPELGSLPLRRSKARALDKKGKYQRKTTATDAGLDVHAHAMGNSMDPADAGTKAQACCCRAKCQDHTCLSSRRRWSYPSEEGQD